MFLLGGYETFIHLLWTNKSSPTSLPIPDVDSCPVNQISSVKNAVKTSQIAIHGHRWASQTLFVKCIRDLQDLYLLMIPTNCGWKTFNILTGNMETFLNFDHLIAIQTRKDDAIPPSIPSCNPHKLQSTHGIPATWRRASVTYAVAMVAVWVTSPTLHGRIPFSTPLLPPPPPKKNTFVLEDSGHKPRRIADAPIGRTSPCSSANSIYVGGVVRRPWKENPSTLNGIFVLGI